MKTGKCEQVMSGHTSEVDSVDIHGNTAASGGFDATVRLWDLDTGKETHRIADAGGTLMWCVYLLSESMKILCPSRKALAMWDVESQTIERTFPHWQGNVMCLYAKGRRVLEEPLITGASDKLIRIWDVETGQEKVNLAGHTESIWSVQYYSDLVISASSDRTVRVWDPRSGKYVETLGTQEGTGFCMWAEGGYVVSGDSNDVISVWSLFPQRRLLFTRKEHEGGIRSIQNDHYKIVSGSWDNTIKVWSFSNGILGEDL